jgi:hypothetical protein
METKRDSGPICFKPLSEGLGFHPFSDGLPYAPVVKQVPRKELPLPAALNPEADGPITPAKVAPAPMGTGAQAAGRPMPVKPGQGPVAAPVAPRISVPVAHATVAGIPAARTAPAARIAMEPNSVRPGQTLSGSDVDVGLQRFGFVYLFKRVVAFGIDAAVNTTLCFLALGAVMVRLELSWDAFSNMSLLLLAIVFLAMFNWSIMTAQEVLLGTTIGKRMFGLVLRGDTSALFLRSFFFLPSLLFCGLGIVWAVFDRRRRCWHDHAVDIQPLELAQL